ncbi:hypothetical protein RRG08_001551 [Elysia crispata]|uniref:Uncharacterized protein n=1 Tax=Elysia crispata TaxID=231223 RepID=A0AAE1AK75_9GAST|nr:hypothetical protein RRG08_001551 [Elysia crispata]
MNIERHKKFSTRADQNRTSSPWPTKLLPLSSRTESLSQSQESGQCGEKSMYLTDSDELSMTGGAGVCSNVIPHQTVHSRGLLRLVGGVPVKLAIQRHRLKTVHDIAQLVHVDRKLGMT